MRHSALVFNLLMTAAAAVALAVPQPAAAQQGRDPQAAQGASRTPRASGAPLVIRTYEVGDLVVNVPDYSSGGGQTSSSSAALPAMGMGGGMGRGGFGGGGGEMGMAGAGYGGRGPMPPADPTVITLDSLIDAMVSCVSRETWRANGRGFGEVKPVGASLVVAQTPEVHDEIREFFRQLRAGSGNRKTLSIDARWLFLNSDDLDELISQSDDGGAPRVNRELLAKLTRRPTSLRARTNCFSGQLVYLISGTRRNIVSSYIPVVGSVDQPDDAQLASHSVGARIVFTQMGREGGRSVGYQPVIEKPNFGALLEIRPTHIQGESAAVVDLKSTLTFPAQETDPALAAQIDAGLAPPMLAPQVDRLAVQELELATTMRVPLGEPVLAGGMTYLAPVAGQQGAAADAAAPPSSDEEQRQLYLVLEVR